MKPVLLSVFLLAACGSESPPATPTGQPAPPGGLLDVASRNPDPPTAVRATHEEMLADRAAPRHPSDGGGRAWLIDGPRSIAANGRGRWTFGFEVGPLGIAAGGMIGFQTSPFWDWSAPHEFNPAMPGFTTVELKERVADDTLKLGVEAPGNGLFMVTVAGRALRPGETLHFVYGASDARAVADRYAEEEESFWFTCDGDGDGVRGLLAEVPTVTIVPGPAADLHLFLPPTAKPGQLATLTATVLDRFGNTGIAFEGELLLARDSKWPGLLPERLVFTAEDRGTVEYEFALPKDATPGVMRIAGGAVTTGAKSTQMRPLTAMSNQMWIDPAAPRLLVGDLHGHSNLSDGTGRPEDFYTYARKVAALDVAVLTDHDHWGMRFLDDHDVMWERITRAVRKANDPGHFTALLGFEWTSWIHGHRHVLYFEDKGPLISSLDATDPDQLWAALRALAGQGIRALTFAHHSAGAPVATNWSFPPDPQFEPVTEVASVHGSSEAWDSPNKVRGAESGQFVRDVLDAGIALGFVGSGDGHDGHPGLAQLNASSGGLAMLYSESNDREGVRASLQARHCYATNGERIVLVVELAGQPMGRNVQAAQLTPSQTLGIKLFGTAPLERLEVIRSGQVVADLNRARLGQLPNVPPDYAAEMPLGEVGLQELRPGEYVYLRVTQAGSGLAWSSPWFIK